MRISGPGCLLLCFIIFFVLIKFWLFIVLLLIIPLIIGKIFGGFKASNNFEFQKKEFKAKPGEVYRECSFCGAKNSRKETNCISCKRAFE